MSQIAAKLSVLSLIALIITFFHRNDFPADLTVSPDLNQEPHQRLSRQPEFETQINGENYVVKPKYEYELRGLVVSYRQHDADGGFLLHALAKDHLNVADLCVVWGESTNPEWLREFEFSNGQFSCNYGTQSQQAWEAFNAHQLSNNHLLASAEHIRDAIDGVKIGDEIHFKGWLAHYVNPLGHERGTSTTRTDTGNGACETIFVNEFSVTNHMHSPWRTGFKLSAMLFVLSTLVYFFSPYQPPHR